MRLVFPAGESLAALDELANAEHAWCLFLRFAIKLDSRDVGLEVRAPADAIEIVRSLFWEPT